MSKGIRSALCISIVVLLVLAFILTGCSAAPVVKAQRPQFCHTSQTIHSKDREQVSSEVTVECTDDQIKRLAEVRLGIAKNCGQYTYWMKKGGYDVQRQGISCQKPDGSWEIVNTAGY